MDTVYTLIVIDASHTRIVKSVTVTVEPDTYTIGLQPEALSFAAPYNYTTPPDAKIVTVKNTGNREVALLQPAQPSSFTVSTLTDVSLAPGETATFAVRPAESLAWGRHSAQITVLTEEESSAVLDVTLDVAGPPPTPTPSPTATPTFDPEQRYRPIPDPTAIPVAPVLTPVPTPVLIAPSSATPKPGYDNDLKALPEPDADKPLTQGGIGRPDGMGDNEYLSILDAILAEIEELKCGYADAPLIAKGLETDIERAQKLYSAVWAQKEPEKLHVLDIKTGTQIVCDAYLDGSVPVLQVELIESLPENEPIQPGKLIVAVDVTLMLDGVPQTGRNIELTLSFKEHKNESIVIAHRLNDGTWEYFDVKTDSEGFARISVSSLSPFVVYTVPQATVTPEATVAPQATAKIDAPLNTPEAIVVAEEQTAAISWWIPALAALAAAIAAGAVLWRAKRNGKER